MGVTFTATPPPTQPPTTDTYVYPDPVPNGTDCHLVFAGGVSATVRVRIYNAAGEPAADVRDGPLSGAAPQLLLPTARFAPGVYLYQVEAQYDTGPPLRTPLGRFIVGRR